MERHRFLIIAGAASAAVGLCNRGASALHPTLGGDGTRSSISLGSQNPGPSDLSIAEWVFPASDLAVTEDIRWVGDSGPVVVDRLVFAVSRPNNQGSVAKLWAIDRAEGTLVWSKDVPSQINDSWSTPTIDRGNATLIYGTGSQGFDQSGRVQARSLLSGDLLWEAELEKDIVNATPLVTTDRGSADRAFITDFEGFYAGGQGGVLYCINVDPFDAATNPYEPGDIVWRAPLFDGASGATPAYDGERVYVATAGDFGPPAVGGQVIAFDPAAIDATGAELWRTPIGGNDGFFGGVSVAGGYVYGATYDFFGTTTSARLLKLNAETGSIVWETASNRTDSIPVALDDGRIALSTGIPGFGSLPALQLFDDLGTSASLLDDTSVATWQDDGDGLIELGEFEIIGGWTHQPHVVLDHPFTQGPVVFVGSIAVPAAGQFFSGYTRLSMVDLAAPFGSPGSVLSVYEGAGSSPAVSGPNLYTIGETGVVGIGAYCPGDVDLSGQTDFFDVITYLKIKDAGSPEADVTLDGTVSSEDVVEAIQRVEDGCE
ncbi:MAG: PQQ-binding-like beta-propeller repeat protein [Planctomycetota bacterium]